MTIPTEQNKQTAKAKIRWPSADEGGRKTPFPGLYYEGVSDFDENPFRGETLWSLVAEFDEPPPVGIEVVARVRFIVDYAPIQVLHQGSKFKLLEGPKVVAVGEII